MTDYDMTSAELDTLRAYCKRVVPVLAPHAPHALPDALDTMSTDDILVVLARAFSVRGARQVRAGVDPPEFMARSGLYNAYIAEELRRIINHLEQRLMTRLKELASLRVQLAPSTPARPVKRKLLVGDETAPHKKPAPCQADERALP
jgi:hypothetical protein